MNHSQKPDEQASETADRKKGVEELSERELDSVAGGVMFDGDGNKKGKREPGKFYPASGPTLTSDKSEL